MTQLRTNADDNSDCEVPMKVKFVEEVLEGTCCTLMNSGLCCVLH